MIVNLKEILNWAKDEGCAIGAFNTPTLENLQSVLECAEELRVPVIIAHAQAHEPVAPLSVIGPIMVMMAKQASVPVCVHLDHGNDLNYIKQAIALGFTSLMYDGSLLDYESNVRNTRKVIALAKPHGISVEAEIGRMQGVEEGDVQGRSDCVKAIYTDPEEARRFAEDTGIDALAASFGTAHGIYTAPPRLDYERIAAISSLCGLPLVMHGGSGCSEENYRISIQKGIRKINYYAYMARAGSLAVKALFSRRDDALFQDVAHAAKEGMKENIIGAMKIFSKG